MLSVVLFHYEKFVTRLAVSFPIRENFLNENIRPDNFIYLNRGPCFYGLKFVFIELNSIRINCASNRLDGMKRMDSTDVYVLYICTICVLNGMDDNKIFI